MNELTTGNKQVATWHIDEIYLTSIWGRIDIYNKGMERATNMEYKNQIPVLKECWTLLKNVYDDFSPYMKNFKKEYAKLYDLRDFIWSKPPVEKIKMEAWIKKFKQTNQDLDERKRIIVEALANKKALLTHKLEYSELGKIKQVMADY